MTGIQLKERLDGTTLASETLGIEEEKGL